jgi:hypothetical protein
MRKMYSTKRMAVFAVVVVVGAAAVLQLPQNNQSKTNQTKNKIIIDLIRLFSSIGASGTDRPVAKRLVEPISM